MRMMPWQRPHVLILLACLSSSHGFRTKKSHTKVPVSEAVSDLETKQASSLGSELTAAINEDHNVSPTYGLHTHLPSQLTALLPASFVQFAGRIAAQHKEASSSQVIVLGASAFVALALITCLFVWLSGMKIQVSYVSDPSSEDAGKRQEVKRQTVTFAPGTKSDATEGAGAPNQAYPSFLVEEDERAFGSFPVDDDTAQDGDAARGGALRLPTLGRGPAVAHSLTSGSEAPDCRQHALSTGSEWDNTGDATTRTTASGMEAKYMMEEDGSPTGGGTRSVQHRSMTSGSEASVCMNHELSTGSEWQVAGMNTTKTIGSPTHARPFVEEDATPTGGATRNIQIRIPTFKNQPVSHTMTTGSEAAGCMQHNLSSGSEWQVSGMNTAKTTRSQVPPTVIVPPSGDANDAGSGATCSPRDLSGMRPQDTTASVASPLASSGEPVNDGSTGFQGAAGGE